jgi:hypothetical protein
MKYFLRRDDSSLPKGKMWREKGKNEAACHIPLARPHCSHYLNRKKSGSVNSASRARIRFGFAAPRTQLNKDFPNA